MVKVRYSYLPQQFSETADILEAIKEVVATGDFTLGKAVEEFEEKFASLLKVKYAIGVASGTDALKIGLKALEIGYGDEVITAANTFVSTVGAINEVGAKPVLVDCDDSYCIDVDQIESAITPRTKAILPVHLTGAMPDMTKITKIAERHGLKIVEDACQAILASHDGKNAGSWGSTAGFSLHPLKNLNVWGDGGVVVTNDGEIADRIRILRNNGIRGREDVEILGYNTRLDSIQAVVGNSLISQTEADTIQRIKNAQYYDDALKEIPQIELPNRPQNLRQVFHIYQVCAEQRDECVRYCLDKGVEIKIHYPTPLYRQKALAFLGYKLGDFPNAEKQAGKVMSLPADQYLSRDEQDILIKVIRNFYANP